jgi:nitrate/nitrite transport system substrate-binding protein
MKDLGMPFTPGPTYMKHKIMGKEFDPAKADAYLKSFAISKA